MHFGDSASEEIGTTVELMAANGGAPWHQRTYAAAELGTVTTYDVLADSDDGANDDPTPAAAPELSPGPDIARQLGVRQPRQARASSVRALTTRG